jgi:plasmid stability protein
MWRLREGAHGRSVAENAQEIIRMLHALRGEIPGMGTIEAGRDFSATPSSFDLALYSEFESREALNAYQNHPAHVAVKEYLSSATLERVVVDYEI